ncbi:MAG: hypothetical protein JW748_04930 [Anaerolineales bacterium]|nr:hypothetical protein [Anaerolineales bacterium]
MANPTHNKNRGTSSSFLDSFFPGSKITYRSLLPVLAFVAIVVLVIGLGSAGRWPSGLSAPAATPTRTRTAPPTASLDACSPDRVRADVEKVHAIMLEFYDASALASQTPADQLLDIIPDLQEIRRRADALKVSGCLDLLRSYQVSHMNMVINTLMAFMSKSDQSILVEGIVQARLLNEEYKKEKARLLGETYVPPPTPTPKPADGTTTPQITATP